MADGLQLADEIVGSPMLVDPMLIEVRTEVHEAGARVREQVVGAENPIQVARLDSHQSTMRTKMTLGAVLPLRGFRSGPPDVPASQVRRPIFAPIRGRRRPHDDLPGGPER